MNPPPLKGMLRALRSVQGAHCEVLTTMAKQLEEESGSRELYDALQAAVSEMASCNSVEDALLFDPRFLDKLRAALAKYRGEA